LTATRKNCGATYTLDGYDRGQANVYAVGIYPEAGVILRGFPDQAALAGFIHAHATLLSAPGNALGTFCESKRGDCHKGESTAVTCYLDVSRLTPNLAEAARLARGCNQKSIAFLGTHGIEIIDKQAGQPFGDGLPVAGSRLATCRTARGE